jgi:hypothetical protein
MRLHIRGLCLWDFLPGEFPCLPSPSAPAQPVISEKTTTAMKEWLLTDYEDRLASFESQFHTYRTWLDEDACAGSVLTASEGSEKATRGWVNGSQSKFLTGT